MSIHGSFNSLFTEVIEEYLSAANACLTAKQDGGILGYPATLLLFCTVEAMGNNLCAEEKQAIGFRDKSFMMLNHACFNLSPRLTENQIKNLGDWYRHQLAHRALLMDGVALRAETSDSPFTFNEAGQPNEIYVLSFYETVKGAWERINKDSFEPSIDALKPRPTTPAKILSLGCATSSGSTSTYSQPASGATTLPEEPSSKSEDSA